MKILEGFFAMAGFIFLMVAVWKIAWMPPYNEYDLVLFGITGLMISALVNTIRTKNE